MSDHRGECKHCHKVRRLHRRGICHACYQSPRVRAKYGQGPGRYQRKPAQETMADVDRLIAERRPTMPGKVSEDVPTDEPKTYSARTVLRSYPRGRRVMRKGGGLR